MHHFLTLQSLWHLSACFCFLCIWGVCRFPRFYWPLFSLLPGLSFTSLVFLLLNHDLFLFLCISDFKQVWFLSICCYLSPPYFRVCKIMGSPSIWIDLGKVSYDLGKVSYVPLSLLCYILKEAFLIYLWFQALAYFEQLKISPDAWQVCAEALAQRIYR